MGDYAQAAELYDILYDGEKDYPAEAALLAQLIRVRLPAAASLLDVACGTGAHARELIDRGFSVDGIDVEPVFVDISRAKCPEGSFHVADMRTFSLPERYDAVLCLFSAVGYARDVAGLTAAIARMAAHLAPGGLLLVDPWFEPGELTHGWISTLSGKTDDVTVCRMARTLVDGSVSRLEFEYLIGSERGLERRSEVHELGLFTQAQMEAAFAAAGLRVHREEKALRTRGIYIGTGGAGADDG